MSKLMSTPFKLYISAAADLEFERDLLGRAVTEIPVDLNWRIEQSPRLNQPLNLEALVEADLHLLLLGDDIRAPIGQEWMIARRAGNRPVTFLKSGVGRTMAAREFVRFIKASTIWQPFENSESLRQQALLLLIGQILNRSLEFRLSPIELNNLVSFQTEVEAGPDDIDTSSAAHAGESSMIISRDRYLPSSGILIEAEEGEK